MFTTIIIVFTQSIGSFTLKLRIKTIENFKKLSLYNVQNLLQCQRETK